MNVTVNSKVSDWISGQAKQVRDMYNTKCTEAVNNDLSTWRDVGRGNHDFRASGDYRVVATKTGNNFNVAAIYRHGTRGGKVKVCGQTVLNY
ncbi:MAG: hypothetical protein R2750_08230 [Bacteroidales bacterium]